jgi:hypothetical protein
MQSTARAKETEHKWPYLQRQRLAPPAHPEPASGHQAPLAVAVVQGVAARRVAAVVVRAAAVPAGGAEAAEQERRHGRGHRHGRPLTTAHPAYTSFSRHRRVRPRLCSSQREEVNQGARRPEVVRPRTACTARSA